MDGCKRDGMRDFPMRSSDAIYDPRISLQNNRWRGFVWRHPDVGELIQSMRVPMYAPKTMTVIKADV